MQTITSRVWLERPDLVLVARDGSRHGTVSGYIRQKSILICEVLTGTFDDQDPCKQSPMEMAISEFDGPVISVLLTMAHSYVEDIGPELLAESLVSIDELLALSRYLGMENDRDMHVAFEKITGFINASTADMDTCSNMMLVLLQHFKRPKNGLIAKIFNRMTELMGGGGAYGRVLAVLEKLRDMYPWAETVALNAIVAERGSTIPKPRRGRSVSCPPLLNLNYAESIQLCLEKKSCIDYVAKAMCYLTTSEAETLVQSLSAEDTFTISGADLAVFIKGARRCSLPKKIRRRAPEQVIDIIDDNEDGGEGQEAIVSSEEEEWNSDME